MNRFENKVVVITGAASGIGEATTRRIVSEGGKVVIADHSEKRAEQLANELTHAGADVRHVYFSATELQSCKELIDFSMNELYVDSTGTHADYPHFFRKSQEKLAREQRRLSHCKKGSSRYMKQKKKIARLHAHIARQRKDYLHKESRKITNFYDLVCIESLNMKEMSQDSRFGKSVHDNGWGMFTDFLSYKLERAGKKLVRIDKWYPSSKICSCCGKLKKELKLEDRMYSCICGNQMNRDENAAINICREGLRILGVELDAERKIS